MSTSGPVRIETVKLFDDIKVVPKVYYKLISADNEVYQISEKALLQSTTLSQCVANLDYTPERIESMDPIPASTVNGNILELVIRWCEKHQDDTPPPSVITNQMRDQPVPFWDQEFLRIDNMTLFHLICAANYLEIRGLLEVACKTVAQMAIGKGPEELRKTFGIPTDEEDEAEAAKKAAEKAAENAEEVAAN